MEKWGRLTEKKVAQQMEWIEVEIIDSREKSLRVYNGKTKAWIPRSQIEDYSEEQFAVGDTIELELPIWLIEEKGLA